MSSARRMKCENFDFQDYVNDTLAGSGFVFSCERREILFAGEAPEDEEEGG